jgi:hypothetical protein
LPTEPEPVASTVLLPEPISLVLIYHANR